MWLLICLLAMAAYGVFELSAKRYIENGTALTPVKLRVTVMLTGFAAAMLCCALGIGESGLAPWEILRVQPLMLVSTLLCFFQELLYLISLRTVGLSIAATIAGTQGIFMFGGMLLINLTTQKLSGVTEMLVPIRLIPIIVILLGIAVLPNTERFVKASSPVQLAERKASGKTLRLGILLLLVSIFCDAGDSLVSAIVLSDGTVGAMDFLLASYCALPLMMLPAYGYLWYKEKKPYNPFAEAGGHSLLLGLAHLGYIVLAVVAAWFDSVRANILWLVYPILPLIFDRLLLKRRYTWRQYLCIGAILTASFVFCLADYV